MHWPNGELVWFMTTKRVAKKTRVIFGFSETGSSFATMVQINQLLQPHGFWIKDGSNWLNLISRNIRSELWHACACSGLVSGFQGQCPLIHGILQWIRYTGDPGSRTFLLPIFNLCLRAPGLETTWSNQWCHVCGQDRLWQGGMRDLRSPKRVCGLCSPTTVVVQFEHHVWTSFSLAQSHCFSYPYVVNSLTPHLI